MKAKRFGQVLIGLLLLLVVIQFVPVDRSNPPVETTITAPPEVMSILRRSCFDCHSNESVWPWYSKVAPISFLVSRDVIHGREELNYSTWQRYDATKQKKMIAKSWEEVEEGEMPPAIYVPLHPDAKLTEQDKQVLSQWAHAVAPEAIREAERQPDKD